MARRGRRRAPARTARTSALATLAAAALALVPAQALAQSPDRTPALTGPQAAGTTVSDPASLVDPIIGTSGAVDAFPGADLPSGMIQWSPDTTPHRPDGGGYEYNDSKYRGYSLAHVSGPGCPAGGDIPILPWTGPLSGTLSTTATGFSHDDESAKAGSYTLKDAAGVTSELAVTTRAGIGRFTFPASAAGSANLLLKLSDGATKIDGTRAQIVGDNEVVGAVDSGHFCGAANTYTLHFDIKFDHPFTQAGTWVGSTVNPNARALSLGAPRQSLPALKSDPDRPRLHGASAKPAAKPAAKSAAPAATPPVVGANGVYLGFDTAKTPTVTARVGISYTSDDGAKKNLAAEIPGFDFAKVKKAGHDAWNRVLGRIAVGGSTPAKQTQFYTALYHALLHPNVFSDTDGQYAGMDHQTHRLAKGQHAQYATYSGWDTYRSQMQLMSVVEPDVASDVVTSMLNGYDQTGLLPKWAQNNGESYVMVGDPADGIIAGANAFGARGFDRGHALDAMVREATKASNDRPGQAVRDALGYLPIDGTGWGCCNFYGPVSTQEEYDSADYAIASFVKSMGKNDTYTTFATRAQDWQNVFNPRSGYLQARTADGRWAAGFSPSTGNGFVEGTSAQYTPMVPFNIRALADARGGNDDWNAFLDSLFTSIDEPTGTNADLSNEPSLEIPWEYDWTGQPWRAQQVVREAQQKLWFDAPVGSFGNDDLGAMSSWYVWSALGMYPEVPGSDLLALGSPVFPTARVALAKGRTLTLNAPAAADDAPYVQSLKVDGKSTTRPWLTFGDLAGGATLDWALGTTPNKTWGAAASDAPPSDATGQRSVLASTGPSTGSGLILAPGATGAGSLDLANISGSAVDVSWHATPPDGVSLAVSNGTVTVPAHGKAQVPLKVTAGQTEGAYTVPIALTASGPTGGTPLPPTSLSVAVAQPGALWPYRDNTGVYADGASFGGGFDGGGWAYSSNALDAAGVKTGGTVTSGGYTFDWPGGTGKPDNITAAGQTIPLSAPDGATSIGFLGAATNAPSAGSTGQVTVTYTDGTTSTGTLTFSDWTLNAGASSPAPGDTIAAKAAYRDTDSGGRDVVATYLFTTSIPTTATKHIASITLPDPPDGSLHLFTLTYGT